MTVYRSDGIFTSCFIFCFCVQSKGLQNRAKLLQGRTDDVETPPGGAHLLSSLSYLPFSVFILVYSYC